MFRHVFTGRIRHQRILMLDVAAQLQRRQFELIAAHRRAYGQLQNIFANFTRRAVGRRYRVAICIIVITLANAPKRSASRLTLTQTVAH